ncbi:MAG TPA: LysR substrate-binding domain-containing protein [Ramlibacter sp.]|nr:LysR substrate-binding domain-containing protein [Ramlibacter sp.]
MKLEQLEHLLAIVEQGSLRAAARRLGIPQPALTRSIRALERELGGPLFLRETSGMVLNEMGRRFHARAGVIVNEARRAQDEFAQGRGEEEGSVVASLSIMPHLGMLPQALQPFRQRYPKVRLRLLEGLFPDVEPALRDGSVDFYLGAAPHQPVAPGLNVRHLFDNTRTIVGRKGHPLARARSLKELADAEWATTSVEYRAEEDLARLFQAHGLPAPRVVLATRSALSLIVGLAYSDLLAMLPRQWEDFPLTRDALQVIRLKEVLPAPEIVLIQRAGVPLTPAAEFLCDVLLRQGPQAG